MSMDRDEAERFLKEANRPTYMGVKGGLKVWLEAALTVNPYINSLDVPPGILFGDPPCECFICRCGCLCSGLRKFTIVERDGAFVHDHCGTQVS